MASALDTVTAYITDARVLLQDTIAPNRYDDASLLVALNVALLEARRLRADLFVYRAAAVQHFTTNEAQVVYVEEPFRLAILYGMCAHAMLRDQEDIQDARAAAFLKFSSDTLLTGRSASPPAQG